MDMASFKLLFLVALLVFASGVPLSSVPGAEAMGPFRCPRMINCTQVCQGFPSRCVKGECICGEDQGPPPHLEATLHFESLCANDTDCISHCDDPHYTSMYCVKGKCLCG